MSKTIRLCVAVVVFFLVLWVWERSGLIKVKSQQETQIVEGQPEVPAQDERQLDPQSVEVAAMVNSQISNTVVPTETAVIVRDKGASVKMMPISRQPPQVVPESSIRKQ